MATYTYTCEEEHDPIQMTLEADSDEAAMKLMIGKVREHLLSYHPDRAAVDDAHIEETVRNNWQKMDSVIQPPSLP